MTVPTAERLPLLETNRKTFLLVTVLLIARLLRGAIVPPNDEIARGAHVGVSVAIALFILARPGFSRGQAALWAALTGVAAAALAIA